jgi:hypothetical protein
MPWDAQGNWIPGSGTPMPGGGDPSQANISSSSASIGGFLPGPQYSNGQGIPNGDVSNGLPSNSLPLGRTESGTGPRWGMPQGGVDQRGPADPAFDYAGQAYGARDYARRFQAGQQWAEGRKAAQLDPEAYASALKAAQGDPNSSAQQALRQGVAGAQQSQQAIGASARGGPQAAAAAQQAAQGQSALLGQQGTNQAQVLKAQEMATGRQQLGQMAGVNLNAQMNQQQLNDALAAGYLGNEMDVNTQQLQAGMDARQQANQIGMNKDQYMLHPGPAAMGAVKAVGTGVGAAIMASDIRAKQDVRPAGGMLGYANQEARQRPFDRMNSETYQPEGGAKTETNLPLQVGNPSLPMENRAGMSMSPTSQQMGSFTPGVYAAHSQGVPPVQPSLPNTVATAPAAYSTQPTSYQAGRFVSDREAKMDAHAEGVKRGLDLAEESGDYNIHDRPTKPHEPLSMRGRLEEIPGGIQPHPGYAQYLMRKQAEPVLPEHVRAATAGAVRGALESVRPSSGHLMPLHSSTPNYSGPSKNLMPWIGGNQPHGPMVVPPDRPPLPPPEPRKELYSGDPKVVFSDEKGKKEKHSEAESFLDSLHGGYSYRYKDPSNEPSSEPTGGRYLGVMAQDLEKSPVGPQIVKDTPKGKVLEGNALLSALAAGTGNLHERLKRVEKLKSRGRR